MTDIEIPYAEERNWRYRFWEIFPGACSWLLLIFPLVLSFVAPTVLAFLVLAYLLIWFLKGISLSVRVLQGWNMMQSQMKMDWQVLLSDLEEAKLHNPKLSYPKWHVRNVERIPERPLFCQPSEVMHAIIVALYNEPREILEPTI